MRTKRFFTVAAALSLGFVVGPQLVRAADVVEEKPAEKAPGKTVEMKENPEFTYWSKFKAGSSTTMSGDMEASGQKMGMEMTVTLVEADKDKGTVTLERSGAMEFNGQKINQPPSKSVVDSKPKANETYKEAGEETLTIAGKELKCKVYEVEQGEGPGKMSARIWVSEEVPGGMVKMTMKGPQGSGELTVKSFDAK